MTKEELAKYFDMNRIDDYVHDITFRTLVLTSTFAAQHLKDHWEGDMDFSKLSGLFEGILTYVNSHIIKLIEVEATKAIQKRIEMQRQRDKLEN
jgi:hypothetical protein